MDGRLRRAAELFGGKIDIFRQNVTLRAERGEDYDAAVRLEGGWLRERLESIAKEHGQEPHMVMAAALLRIEINANLRF